MKTTLKAIAWWTAPSLVTTAYCAWTLGPLAALVALTGGVLLGLACLGLVVVLDLIDDARRCEE